MGVHPSLSFAGPNTGYLVYKACGRVGVSKRLKTPIYFISIYEKYPCISRINPVENLQKWALLAAFDFLFLLQFFRLRMLFLRRSGDNSESLIGLQIQCNNLETNTFEGL